MKNQGYKATVCDKVLFCINFYVLQNIWVEIIKCDV